MFTSLSISSARSELWAAGRISRPPRVFVCMHIYAIVYLAPTEVIKSAVIDRYRSSSSPSRTPTRCFFKSVTECVRASTTRFIFEHIRVHGLCFPISDQRWISQIFSFPAFLCLCDWSSSARSNYNLSVLLCKQHILHLHSWAVILTWRLMMIIVAHHWTTMRFNLQTLNLTSTD